jgi:hypothetical protein
MFADNASGRFVSHQFNTPVIPHGPSHVAVSSGVVYGGWTAMVNRTFVAARVGGVWDGAYASPAGAEVVLIEPSETVNTGTPPAT